jgi:hypothetical protein
MDIMSQLDGVSSMEEEYRKEGQSLFWLAVLLSIISVSFFRKIQTVEEKKTTEVQTKKQHITQQPAPHFLE